MNDKAKKKKKGKIEENYEYFWEEVSKKSSLFYPSIIAWMSA